MGLTEFLRRKPVVKEVRHGSKNEYEIEYAIVYPRNGEKSMICTVGVRKEAWEAAFRVKHQLHMQVAEYIGLGGIGDERQFVLTNPRAHDETNEKTIFEISFREGPKLVNLGQLYPWNGK